LAYSSLIVNIEYISLYLYILRICIDLKHFFKYMNYIHYMNNFIVLNLLIPILCS